MDNTTEHIETLEDILGYATAGARNAEALRAAIELMRAAQPLDPAAEREHCERLQQWHPSDGPKQTLTELLMRARAEARAEGYAQADLQHAQAGAEMDRKLSAARAEIERLKAAASQVGEVCDQFETKLTNLRTASERYLRAYHEDEFPAELAHLSNDEATDALVDQLGAATHEASR